MNDQTNGILWTDQTWNPITGCYGPEGTSERPRPCSYCYARALAHRFGRSFEPAFHPELLDQPLKRKKPSMIFAGSTADMFGSFTPVDWIGQVLCIVKRAHWHTFQFLTKNPKRLPNFNPWPDNCWVGASVDVRARLDPTLAALRKVAAPVRFISFEPLNEDMGRPDLTGIEWVIIGAQTGPRAHQPESTWVEQLLASAANAGAAVMLKENLIWQPRRTEFPNHQQASAQGPSRPYVQAPLLA